MPVNAAAGQDPYAGPTVIQGAPGGTGAPGGDPAQTAWSSPFPAPSAEQPTALYAQGQAPQPSQPQQPPAYTPPPQPPAYTPQPPQPVYGQPQTPAYGAPAQPWPAQTPPQKKSRAGCVVGALLAVVLVVALAAGGLWFLSNRAGGLTIGGATIGGNANSGPGIIYQDSLNGSTKEKWPSESYCFFGSGGYHINAAYICYAPAPADKVGDAVTTVAVTQTSGPITYPYGLIIRRASAGNYYEFLIDGNGKWLFDKVVNKTTTDIVKFTANKAIKTGLNQPNTISVQAKGSHFVFSVNGTQVGTADDSTFTKGETGLSGSDGIEVVYSNLVVKEVK